MLLRIFLTTFLCFFASTLSEPALNITPCRRFDSVCINNFAKVLYAATIQGRPQLNIDALDPLYHDFVEGNLAFIKYTIRNGTITGFKDCQVANTMLTSNLTNLRFEMQCPLLEMVGLYTIDGQIIMIPIQGNGEFRVATTHYHLYLDAEMKLSPGFDGKTYVKLKKYRYDAELRGDLYIEMENLFNGRKDLAEPVLNFVRNNGKTVSQLLQEPVVAANIKKIIINYNKYLKTLPVDDIILD